LVSQNSGLEPPWAGLPAVGEYPFEETHDLRQGPDLHKSLLALLPLVGVWRGRGQGGYPTLEDDFHYGQEIRFSHDGRPFLFYEARSWIIEPDGTPVRPANCEVGWWRTGPGDDEVEVLLTQPTGFLQLYVGRCDGPTRWEMVSDAIVRTVEAKEVRAEQRLYGVVEGVLLYAIDLAAVGQPMQSHLSARLERVAG
jgi:hypothetical protein